MAIGQDIGIFNLYVGELLRARPRAKHIVVMDRPAGSPLRNSIGPSIWLSRVLNWYTLTLNETAQSNLL